MSSLPRVNILGVGITVTNLSAAADELIRCAESGSGGYVNICTVHSIMEAQDDPAVKAIYNDSLMATPDGMPLSWIGWSQGFKEMDRTYGPDLMLEILQRCAGKPLSHFFYGGRDGVAAELAETMRTRYPQTTIAGSDLPPFRPLTSEERASLVARLRERKVAFLWVGISSPKQDKLMAELAPWLPGVVMIGVGAAFDFHTGRVRQAPRWIQRAGMEWFFRFTQEPKRLWKRYLKANPRFVFLYALQRLGWRKFPIISGKPPGVR